MFGHDSLENFVLDEIEKIIRERWRMIERSTRYGWLIAGSKASTISPENAATISALANKIGYENSRECLLQVRRVCRDAHPYCVPKMAISILDEMYTLVILRKRGRESRWQNVSLRISPPTVYTISKAVL